MKDNHKSKAKSFVKWLNAKADQLEESNRQDHRTWRDIFKTGIAFNHETGKLERCFHKPINFPNCKSQASTGVR